MLGTFRPAVKNSGSTHPQTFVRSSLGATTPQDAAIFENRTPASAGSTIQVSPDSRWRGHAWNTSTLTSKTIDFRTWVAPASSSTPYGVWKLQHSVDGAAYADLLSVDGNTNGGRGVTITPPSGGLSNGSPGTTRHLTFDNTGSYTWTDYRFSGTLRAAIGANSGGGMSMYASGGNVFDYYQCNSGLGSCSLIAYNYSSGFVHYQDGRFGGKVGAGSTSQPSATLQSYAGLALKVKRITASQTLDDTATHWLSDGTTAAACTGTASVSCGTYTTEGDCIARSSHGGGCAWNPGTSCSVFNNESGMGSCSAQSPCVVETASCSGATDQTACEAQDDSYGGSCAWQQTGDCTAAADETACNNLNARGCTTNYFDCASNYNYNEAGCTGYTGCSVATANSCSSYTSTAACSGDAHCTPVINGDCTALSDGGGDGTMCATQPECAYDSGTGACTGLYFTSCGGDNSTCTGTPYLNCTGSYYQCDGTYNTGNCNGTYGAACTGTPNCGGISNSTDCGNETGCAWQSVLLLELPNMLSRPDQTYFISNDASNGADTRITCPVTTYPATTINGASYWDLEEYQDGVELAPYANLVSCSTAADQSACTALVDYGCAVGLSYCSYNTMDNLCTGDAGSVCSAHNGNQSSCEAQQYYTGCSGNYYVAKEWRVYAERKKKGVTYTTITYDNEILRSDGTTGKIQGSGIIASDGGYISWAGTSPTARLHLPAGTATAGTAPLKFIIGTFNTSPEQGAMEWAGSNMPSFCPGGGLRYTFAALEYQQTWTATQIFKHSSGSSVPLRVQEAASSPTADLQRWEKAGGSTPYWANLDAAGLFDYYGGVQTNGKAFPAIYKIGRSTGQTAAVASVAAYTNAAADGTFEVSANVLVTTSTVHSFTVEVTYTDEGNTARTLTLPFTVLAGTSVTAIANAAGAVPYAGIPVHIRVKASTAITVKTTGTFTTVTYNVEGVIKQIA